MSVLWCSVVEIGDVGVTRREQRTLGWPAKGKTHLGGPVSPGPVDLGFVGWFALEGRVGVVASTSDDGLRSLPGLSVVGLDDAGVEDEGKGPAAWTRTVGQRRFPARRTGAEAADGVGRVVRPADDTGVGVVVFTGSTPVRVGHVPEWLVQLGAFLWQIATPFAVLWLDRLLNENSSLYEI